MEAQFIDHMGTDRRVVEAARVSFANEEWYYDEMSDTNLIIHLAKYNHWSPFAHTSITLRMTAPVPIRTQCFKHKVGFSENEQSRRYISLRPSVFVPESFREKPKGNIKQGSGDTHSASEMWLSTYERWANAAVSVYEEMIEHGVCPEQARFILPQGVEVSWYWTGSLAAYARFFNQRTDPHAQKEIQDLAREVGDIIEPLYPRCWDALTKDRNNG